MKKKIFTILPFKESLNPNIAGAVSIYVKDTLKYSKYKKYIKVISSDNMKSDIIFRNKSYINSFCEKHKNYIPIRVFYTCLIYLICFIGFVDCIKKSLNL